MSIQRIDQYPGRGSGSSCRHQRNPVNVAAAAASQRNTPTASTHGVDPNDSTTSPAMATASPMYPPRRAQTAILQCPLFWSSGGSRMIWDCCTVLRPGSPHAKVDPSCQSPAGWPTEGMDPQGMPDTGRCTVSCDVPRNGRVRLPSAVRRAAPLLGAPTGDTQTAVPPKPGPR